MRHSPLPATARLLVFGFSVSVALAADPPSAQRQEVATPAPANNVFSTPDSTIGAGQYTSITVGTDGLGVISYFDSNTGGHLKVAHCSNVDCSSATVNTVDGAFSVGQNSSITIGTDGLPIISYFDAANVTLKVAHCSDLLCSSSAIHTLDKTNGVGLYTSATIVNGFPFVAYTDLTNNGVKVAVCPDVTCSAAPTITTIDSNANTNTGQFTAAATGADGFAFIAYFANIGTSVFGAVRHCSNSACSNSGANIFPTGQSGSVTYISTTVGIDGLPLIAFYTGAKLDISHCADLLCASASGTTLDSSSTNVGRFTSVTIGSDGLGLISYYDDTNSLLKVAHCSDVACSSALVSTVDISNVGQYTSVTIGSDGLPLVSYYDVRNMRLKVLHCANTLCTPFFRRR